jgi:hypothetical protein
MECNSNTGLLKMKQSGLIERVVEALGLDDGYAWGKHTPAETKLLVNDEDGVAAAEGFSYSSDVGMLLALTCIGRHLKNTSSCGMVINPTRELTIDAYPDADLARMYGHEKPTDPVCAKSHSGFAIVFTGVPVLWQSNRQTQTALSTMVIALGACMRELIPIMDMVQSLAIAVGISAGDVIMRISVHEDNSGALVLAETLPPQFMPRSKYYATKTIWFCEEINKRGINFLKIETFDQVGDMFTKGLAKPTFEYL